MTHWSNKLKKYNACPDAVDWCKTQKSFKSAWKNCKNGEWMFWLLNVLVGKVNSVSHRKLMALFCEYTKIFLKYVPKEIKQEPVRDIIKIFEKYTKTQEKAEILKNDIAYEYNNLEKAFKERDIDADYLDIEDDILFIIRFIINSLKIQKKSPEKEIALYPVGLFTDLVYELTTMSSVTSSDYISNSEINKKAEKEVNKMLKTCANAARKMYSGAPRIKNLTSN